MKSLDLIYLLRVILDAMLEIELIGAKMGARRRVRRLIQCLMRDDVCLYQVGSSGGEERQTDFGYFENTANKIF